MTDDYTPSTATVRECFLDGAAGEFVGVDFDRWLRETAARAWDEGAEAGYDDAEAGREEKHNPYREGGAT